MSPPPTCPSCEALMAATSNWCWLCLAPRSAGETPVPAAPQGQGRPQRLVGQSPRQDVRGSRWRKSAITFGPLGRLCWTAALLVPLVLFVDFVVVGGWVGVVVYGGIILPWALRDLWQRDR